MKIKCKKHSFKINKTIKLKNKKIYMNTPRTEKKRIRKFKHYLIDIDFSFFRKIKIKILNPKIKRQWKNKTGKVNTELLPHSRRKKNVITFTDTYSLFFFEITFIKKQIIVKQKLRKIFKEMGVLE
jgi:hypothetical protein